VSPKKLARRLIPVVLLLLAAAAALAYVRKQNQPKPLVLGGTLEARTVNVGSLVGGRVTRVHVDEGSHVVAGQTLVTLETETIDRQLDEQKAAIAAAEAQLDRAQAGPREDELQRAAAIANNDERDRIRHAELLQAGIVSRQAYDAAATKAKASREELELLRKGTHPDEIRAAEAQAEQQRRKLATLLKQRAETTVKSTVGGIVQSFGLRPGDIVAPNQTVAEILESDQLWVRVYVPETLLGLVTVNMPVQVHIDTYPNEWFQGRVGSVASQGEYTPRNVQTRAQRAEQVFGVKVYVTSNPKLKPGMAAEVDLGVKGRVE
jgi:multidrug resistance efflux pump